MPGVKKIEKRSRTPWMLLQIYFYLINERSTRLIQQAIQD